MTDRRAPFAGRLVSAIMGWSRCSIKIPDPIKPTLIVQEFDTNTEVWKNTDYEIKAYWGLPMETGLSDEYTYGTIVWCIYIFRTYFIVLGQCL